MRLQTCVWMLFASVVFLGAATAERPTVEAWAKWRNSLEPSGDTGQRITLVRDGKTSYRIVVSADATTMDHKAAEDLAQWLRDMTGAAFAIGSDAQPPASHEICIGKTNREPTGGSTRDLSFHGYRIAQEGERLFILGGSRSGVINGVYALLEEDLGCRWYNDRTGIRIPHRATLTFTPMLRTSVPQLIARDSFYYQSWNRDFALANRLTPLCATGHRPDSREIPAEWGGGMRYYPRELWVHSYGWLVPWDQYRKSNPEYFMVNERGRRHKRQLCETNPAVAEVIIDRLLEALKAHPDIQLISVSKNDGGGTCQCDTCRSLNEAEGTDAASLLTLVNRVAEGVAPHYPDVVITTLAYLETIRPPKTIRPAPNVGIRVCNDKVSWPTPFKPAQDVPEYVEMVERWSQVCNRIYVWDYGINFSHQIAPMPNMYAIEQNVRFFVRNHAQGYMAQSNYESACAEREWMRSWVIAKLMWEPSRDVWTLMQDFVWGYYGEAAPAVAKYYALLWNMEWDEAPKGGIRYEMTDPAFTPAFMEEAFALFAEAEGQAESEEIRRRVEREFISVMYAQLMQGPERIGREAYAGLIFRFEDIAVRENMDYFREASQNRAELLEQWRKAAGM